MEFEIDEVESVEFLNDKEQYVYDVGMKESPHTFFANGILVHNSVYVNFGKILDSIHYPTNKKLMEQIKNFIIYAKDYKNEDLFGTGEDDDGNQIGGIPKSEREKLENNCKSIQNYVSNIINRSMENLTLKKFNCNINKISFKREAVASTGCFLKRKRYVLHVLNNEGVETDKLKSTGVDLVRSSTPVLVQKALKKIILDILLKQDEKATEESLREFRTDFLKAKPEDVGRPTSVNGLDEYSERMDKGDFKAIQAHFKASYYYNQMLKKYPKIATTYEFINDGDKMKWVATKTGENWMYDAIGFKDRLPPEFGLHEYIDYNKQFEKTFESALKDFYEVMNWSMPNLQVKDVSNLFEW